jgi:hypothetical protein
MRVRGGMMPMLEDSRLMASAPDLLTECRRLKADNAKLREALDQLIETAQYAVNRLNNDTKGPQQVRVSGDLSVNICVARAALAGEGEQ